MNTKEERNEADHIDYLIDKWKEEKIREEEDARLSEKIASDFIEYEDR